MHVSRKSDYAMRAMAYLAARQRGNFVLAGKVALDMAIPPVFLSKIMKQLVEAGLVESKSGPGGGYTLARAPGTISFRSVMEAVDGPLEIVPCHDDGAERCLMHEACSQQQVWDAIRSRMADVLEEYTLDAVRTQGLGTAVRVVVR